MKDNYCVEIRWTNGKTSYVNYWSMSRTNKIELIKHMINDVYFGMGGWNTGETTIFYNADTKEYNFHDEYLNNLEDFDKFSELMEKDGCKVLEFTYGITNADYKITKAYEKYNDEMIAEYGKDADKELIELAKKYCVLRMSNYEGDLTTKDAIKFIKEISKRDNGLPKELYKELECI